MFLTGRLSFGGTLRTHASRSTWYFFPRRRFCRLRVPAGPYNIDVKTEKEWRHWCHHILIDSIFQKSPIITPQKRRTVQHPGDAFEETAFEPGFEFVNL
jgi:hypothetical protein